MLKTSLKFDRFTQLVNYTLFTNLRKYHPVGWGCPGYDTKQSDGDAPVILELWGMRSTSSLPSLPGPL